MRCPSCGSETPPESRFCARCGAGIAAACTHCDARLPAGANFCPDCGTAVDVPIATPAVSASPAERRQLTVMFVDLVGSTALSEQLDPEDLAAILSAYQQSCRRCLETWGGFVARPLGDGLLIYFGYPRAQEDAPARAIRAALEIVQALPPLNDTLRPQHAPLRESPLRVRIGVHTGLVVVGDLANAGTPEQVAVGETPNIAARLQGVAGPDEVVISDVTLRLVPGMFQTEDLGTPALKGVAAPIGAHRVLGVTGVRDRVDVDPSHLTPLVGRAQELDVLRDRFGRTGDGEGQVVLVSGEPGVGKSRLLRALRERVADGDSRWIQCHCSPYTQGNAFHPLRELIEQGAGFEEGDDLALRADRLEKTLQRSGLPVTESMALLAPLAALPARYATPELPPDLLRKRTIETLVAWTLALGATEPVVFLVEDLHWCDPSTLEFLGPLLEQAPMARVLVLLSYRPEFGVPWPQRSHHTYVQVSRLRDRHAEVLVRALSGARSLPGEVLARIVERADGVPLFLEELTKTVVESPLLRPSDGGDVFAEELSALAIPATLQDSLTARLDRLGVGKEVAQVGSVLGRRFSYELLRALSPLGEESLGEGLRQLIDAELLFQRSAPPAAFYTFKHALVQDAAYQSLLRGVRRTLHRRAAEVLEARDNDGAAAPLLAYHFAEAGDAARAIPYYRSAGERAKAQWHNLEAVTHLTRGLALLAEQPASAERDHQALAFEVALGPALMATKGVSSRQAEQAYRRARELCETTGETEQLTPVLWGLWRIHHQRADFAAALKSADMLSAAAESLQHSGPMLQAHHAQWTTRFSCGQIDVARAHAERGVAIYRREEHHGQTFAYGNHDPCVCGLTFASWTLWLLGYPDRGRQRSRAAAELATELSHPLTRSVGARAPVILEQLRRDTSRARESAAALMEVSMRGDYQFPFYRPFAPFVRGWALAQEGRIAAGLELMREGLAALSEAMFVPYFLVYIAEALGETGATAEALAELEEAQARIANFGGHFFEAEMHRMRGELLNRAGGADAAEAEFHHALEIARGQRAKSLELRAATSLARLWSARGKRSEVRKLLTPVYDWFSEGFETPDLIDARETLQA